MPKGLATETSAVSRIDRRFRARRGDLVVRVMLSACQSFGYA
jgi:hypothetical protein